MAAAEHRESNIEHHRDDADVYRAEFRRVHERIDDVGEKVGKLATAIEVSNALHRDCRVKVIGNGKEGLDTRVTKLETTMGVSKWWLGTILTAATIIGGLVSAGIGYVSRERPAAITNERAIGDRP